MKVEQVLDAVVMVNAGKPVAAVPPLETVQVHPAAGAALPGTPAQCLAELRAAYPQAAFVWFAEPLQKPGKAPAAPPAAPKAGK